MIWTKQSKRYSRRKLAAFSKGKTSQWEKPVPWNLAPSRQRWIFVVSHSIKYIESEHAPCLHRLSFITAYSSRGYFSCKQLSAQSKRTICKYESDARPSPYTVTVRLDGQQIEQKVDIKAKNTTFTGFKFVYDKEYKFVSRFGSYGLTLVGTYFFIIKCPLPACWSFFV